MATPDLPQLLQAVAAALQAPDAPSPAPAALSPPRSLYAPEDFEERAAILEYDQGFSRAEAERIARAVCGAAPDAAP